MEEGREFIDYYGLLEVSPDCSDKALELAYHDLAKRYHPDNQSTGDVDKFGVVLEAYRFLRDPERRSAYDHRYFPEKFREDSVFQVRFEEAIDEKTALADAEMHARILLYLYRLRRERPTDAGVIQWLLQEALGCTEEEIDFHVWYLRAKGFIEVTEGSGLAITIAGVDEVISLSRSAKAERLLIAQAPPQEPETPQADPATSP